MNLPPRGTSRVPWRLEEGSPDAYGSLEAKPGATINEGVSSASYAITESDDMEYSDKLRNDIKRIFKEEHNTEFTDEEANEALNSLAGLYGLFYEIAVKDQRRKNRLKKESDGFPVESAHTCIVCHTHIDSTNGWYDQYLQKCFPCRDAVRAGIIPPFVTYDHDSYFLTWQINRMRNIKTPTTRKMTREGKFVARIIPNKDGKPYDYVYLKKENPELARLDPHRRSSARKSYDRHQKKLSDAHIRGVRTKSRKEHEKSLKKLSRK